MAPRPSPRTASRAAAWLVFGLVCLARPPVALAQDAAPDAPAAEIADDGLAPGVEPGFLPFLAALVPGVVLHGSGVFAAGDTDTAVDLLIIEGAGVAAALAGYGMLVGTNVSRELAAPGIVLFVGGAGLFLQTWLADLYGSVAGGSAGRALGTAPLADLRVGYRYVYDPQFEYGSFVHLAADLGLGDFRISPSALLAVDDDTQRVHLEAAWRFLGGSGDPDAPASSGSQLELETGLAWHRLGTYRFSTLTPHLQLVGRLDLADLGAILAGSFAELDLGWAWELYDYEAAGLDLATDTNSVLLLRFAWGLFLGTPGASELGHGEVSIFYDHRRDLYAGGIGPSATREGVGHFGLEGLWAIAPDEVGDGWGVGLELALGSAVVTGLDLVYRFGGR